MTNQEIGATFEYQGHCVSFEWQSRHARSRTAVSLGRHMGNRHRRARRIGWRVRACRTGELDRKRADDQDERDSPNDAPGHDSIAHNFFFQSLHHVVLSMPSESHH